MPPSYKIVKANAQGSWGVNLLLYGNAGSGKTTLAGSVADSEYGKPVLVVDAEGGSRVLGHRGDIDVISINDLNDLGAPGYGWQKILDVLNDLLYHKIKHESGCEYGTVIFDNMSEYIDLAIKHVIRTIGRNIELKDRPDPNDWGKATSEMLLFTRRARDHARSSKTNMIFIAWELESKNDQGQVLKNGLLFNPALARKIPGIVDWVGYLSVVGGDRRELSFEASNRTDAKFRRDDTELANQIPLEIRWSGKGKEPLCDILATIKGAVPFPIEKYRPKKQA